FYDKGNYSDGWRYLEAAPADLTSPVTMQWYNGNITTDATGTGYGTGKLNASKITSAFSGDYAAQRCANYTSGAYNDWFLPSKEELNAMYTELHKFNVGNFYNNGSYWSSSEDDETQSWMQTFDASGAQSDHAKSEHLRVRAVRSFGPDATAPTLPSDKTITAIAAGSNPITLSWNYASDNSTEQSSLQYRVYYSTSNNISDVSACEANGTPAGYYTTNINTKTVSVSLNTNYFFNVVVRDNSGNKAHYTAKSAKLYSVSYNENGATSGSPPATNYYINEETVTVAENTGGLVKMQDGISLKFDGWKKGSGTTYQPGETFAMSSGNVALTAQWSVLGGIGPAGGVVFFINNDMGNVHRDGWKYLEAAPRSTEWESKPWAPSDSGVDASATVVGAGKRNTIKIIARHGNGGAGNYAAKLCADLSHDGYNDWFLPSFYDLSAISGTLITDGDLSADLYWSSSEVAAPNQTKAYARNFSGGSEGSRNKNTLYRVRAVRSFGNDATPPTFSSGNITITGVDSTSVKLEWALATDGGGSGSTEDDNLQYRIYYSTSDNISTVADCEANGTPFGYYNYKDYYYSAPANRTVTGLTGISTGTTYWFNIVVRDNSGNKSHYAAKSAGLFKVTYDENGDTTGDVPVDNNYYATGQTVTVAGNTGGLEKIENGISLRLLWNTNASGPGTSYKPADATFDMPSNNVTLYARWTALGCTGPAGGLIFYDKGSYSYGWRYMEAAPLSEEVSKIWGAQTQVTDTSPDVGKGKQNTINIINHYGASDYAAKLCGDLSYGGFDDWFLPSSLELGAMYTNLYKSGIGGFSGAIYWSSSEYSANAAVMRNFGESGSGGAPPPATSHSKDNTCRVRAARSF
ncbi:MAG TPA: hypothetical protein PK900_09380, partial [Spirochaetota bacterium]|nr:hypothetical protein [Spirochaetota bacterium]